MKTVEKGALCSTIYHVLRDKKSYRDLGADYFDDVDKERLNRQALRQLEALGYTVTLTPKPGGGVLTRRQFSIIATPLTIGSRPCLVSNRCTPIELKGGPLMSTEENKALVHRFFEEVIHQKNLAALDQFVSPTAVNHTVPAGLPQGPSQFLSMHLSAFPGVKASVVDLLADGNKVVALVSIHSTRQGAFRTASPTGKPISVMAINIFRIEHGKMVEHWGLADRLSALQQLGIASPPA